MTRRALVLSALVVLGALAFTPPVEAQDAPAFGISPVSMSFDSPPALRGQTYTKTLRVMNQQDTPTTVTVTPEGDVDSWVSLDPAQPFLMAANTTRAVTVTIQVPDDAANGQHAGKLRVRALGGPSNDTGSGSSVALEVVSTLSITVTGDQVLSFALDGITVENAVENRPLNVVARVVNDGNVRADADLLLNLKDADGQSVLTEVVNIGFLEPRTGDDVLVRTTGTIPDTGDYRLFATLRSDGKDFGAAETAFAAIPESEAGETLPEARVLDVSVAPATVGRPVAIEVDLKNTGFSDITAARYSVKVYKDGVLADVKESDVLRIAPGATATLEAYWTPHEQGDHVLKGHVTYDGVKHDLPERTVTVQAAGTDGPGSDADATQQDTRSGRGLFGIPGPGALLALMGLGAAAGARRRT